MKVISDKDCTVEKAQITLEELDSHTGRMRQCPYPTSSAKINLNHSQSPSAAHKIIKFQEESKEKKFQFRVSQLFVRHDTKSSGIKAKIDK